MTNKPTPVNKLVSAIAAVCRAPALTVKNTVTTDWVTRYEVKLTNAQEGMAIPFLQRLGFTETPINGTGCSTQGDFSSDVYGSKFTHPNGAVIEVGSRFRLASKFFINAWVHDEQASEILADPSTSPKMVADL